MLEQKERIIIALVISISAIIFVTVAILAILDRQPAEQTFTEYHHEHYHHDQHLPSEPLAESSDESAKTDVPAKTGPQPTISPKVGPSAKTDTTHTVSPKRNLKNIISNARTWGPVYISWAGEMAPDFTLIDVTGKRHKLSDYRGKNVIIMFWATWCRPCIMELPHLIALRNTVSEDKLAMLAISNEPPALVKRFATREKINYAVFAVNTLAMPAPFRNIASIPSNFFINPDGKIKLATSGLLPLDDLKAILQAE